MQRQKDQVLDGIEGGKHKMKKKKRRGSNENTVRVKRLRCVAKELTKRLDDGMAEVRRTDGVQSREKDPSGSDQCVLRPGDCTNGTAAKASLANNGRRFACAGRAAS